MPSGRIRRFTWIVANTTLALVVLAACGGGQAPAATSAPAKAGSAPASGAPAESKPAAPTESKPAVSAQSSPTAAAANPTAAAVKPPAAPAKPAPSGPPIKLRIATPSNSMLFLQPILADRLGYFKEAGLDVELNIMSSAGNAQAALISGSVDIASLSPDDVVNVISKGQQLLVFEVNFLPYAGEMPLRKDTLAKLNVSPTAPVEDRFKALKGLKIGVTGTTSLHNQALTASLRSVGLDPQKDVDVIGTGSIEAMIASLERGHIDAYVVAPPNSTISVARGHAVMFLSGFKNEFPAMRNVIMEAAFARQQYVDQNPEAVQRVTNAFVRVAKLIRDNPEQAKAAARGFYENLPADVFDAVWETSKAGAAQPDVTRETIEATIKFRETVSGEKFTKTFVQVSTNRFVDEAKKVLGW